MRNVGIDYMLGTGENKIQSVTVPAQSRYSVDVAAFVGAGHDVPGRITAKYGRAIITERPLYFEYRNMWPCSHDALGC